MTDGCAAIPLLKEVFIVRDDLLGKTFSLFVASQVFSWLMYTCTLVAAVSYLGCCDITVKSSAYDTRCVFGCVGAVMSCM